MSYLLSIACAYNVDSLKSLALWFLIFNYCQNQSECFIKFVFYAISEVPLTFNNQVVFNKSEIKWFKCTSKPYRTANQTRLLTKILLEYM